MSTASTGKLVFGKVTVKMRDTVGAGAAVPLHTSTHKLVLALRTDTFETAPGL